MVVRCRSPLTYVANHRSTLAAWLRIFASALPCSVVGICLPVTEDTRLCDDAFSVACRTGDEAFYIMSDVLPVLLGCRAEMNDVRTGEILAKYGQQLVL